MLSSRSIAGLVIIIILAGILIYRTMLTSGSPLIVKARPGYDRFLENFKEYKYHEQLDAYANETSDEAIKKTIADHKSAVMDVVSMHVFNRVLLSADLQRKSIPDDFNFAKEIKDVLEKIFHGAIPSIGDIFAEVKTIELQFFELGYLPVEALSLFPGMYVLNISGTKLKTGFGALKVLPTLTALYLCGNEMTEIPDLSECGNLEEVYLDCNKIVKVSLDAYKAKEGDGYVKLNVKYLSLRNSQIEEIDNNFHAVFPHLKALYLEGNKLQEKPKCLESYGTETTIEYKGNPFIGQ